MKLYVGTSGFAYREWKNKFYPGDLPIKQMLGYYAERFRAVEINNSFYSMPNKPALKSWSGDVPHGFQFAFKAPQRITHFRRLKNVRGLVSAFFKVIDVIKPRLGPILFQLPPNMKKDAARLAAFLQSLPRNHRIAFE